MELLQNPEQILTWYVDAGVDEAIGEQPLNRYDEALKANAKRVAQAQSILKSADDIRGTQPIVPSPPPSMGPVPVRPSETLAAQDTIKLAVEAATGAKTLEDLTLALQDFEGCGLKKGATNLVFTDGPANARVLLIGDIPGEDEDRQGIPFVGQGGQLLEKMLRSIGLDRSDVLLCNAVFWRPPGKRSANSGEISVCLPFVERLVEIVDPKMLVTLGGPTTHSLLAQQGHISKLVGHWHTYATPRMSHPIAACALYHPDFLLTSPGMKRQAWANLLDIQQKLKELTT